MHAELVEARQFAGDRKAAAGGIGNNIARGVMVVALLLATAAMARADDKHDHATTLVEGLSGHHHPVTTESERAQEFFDQGLELAWAFNHHAAVRAFRKAQELDPECAMCFWGEAWALGPNINAPMDPEAVPVAWAALEKARELAARRSSSRERAYIDALGDRYRPQPEEDRSELDLAYAIAARVVALRFPDDLDAAVISAEALMDTMPWDYWLEDGSPKPQTTEFLGRLETVLRRDPDHPGANHLLIHAVEKVRPELGIPSAERLESLSEGAGHLVHMGGHIFIRVGRYRDAMRVNEKAIAADEKFAAEHEVSDLYAYGYALHNIHFLVAAAGFAGDAERAIEAALELRSRVGTEVMRQPGMSTTQHFWLTPYFVWARFGRWDEILAAPEPDADLLYPRAARHYARGLALARRGEIDAADAELAALRELVADEALEDVTVWDLNDSRTLMRIGENVLAGEIEAARDAYDGAVAFLEAAVALEDGLTYDEPPPWMVPVRQHLGAVLLEAGRLGAAESVYREDLDKYPNNGWSLEGLRQTLVRQGRTDDAAEVAERLKSVWEGSQVELVGSRF
ncbi:MAG: hypothetical protein DWQ36_03285 [Acidobacteria bacterium]|nr:MAG: hypothetical protein DWQ30_17015 [Acidobacteriota bacterium]REK10989.1 MAG: hypothetical protein DWQ36_03285 [Acidobacteriota bacterium]